MGGACAEGAPLSPYDTSRVTPATPPPAPSSPLSLPSAPAAPPVEDVTPRFVLQSVQFEGARAVDASRLAPAWTALRGKPVSLSDLRAIGRAAERIYADAGYPFVAVVLQIQEVDQGTVRFDVVEGRITELTILGKDPIARRQATAYLQPIVGRQPLSVGGVETAYELTRHVPGLSISGALRRGAEPGGMDLVVAAKRDPAVRFYANVDNLYADPVGPWGVLVGADYLGSTTYGDQGGLQVYTSSPVGRQVLVRGSYFIGLDSAGTQVGVSGLWGKADPQGDFAALKLATDIETLRLEVLRPLLERRNATLIGHLAFDASSQRTKVFGSEGLADDKLRVFSASLTGDVRSQLGWLSGSLEVRQGVDSLGASREGAANLSRVGGDPQAMIVRASFEGETPVVHYMSLAARSDLQYSGVRLTTPDQYTVGNLTIGRGYQPGEALGDNAVAGSLEFRLGPFKLPHKLELQPFAFVDSVWLDNHGAALISRRTLTSAGGGFRLQMLQKLRLELTYAAPQDAIVPGAPRPTPRILLNLTFNLNDAYSAIHRRIQSEAKK